MKFLQGGYTACVLLSVMTIVAACPEAKAASVTFDFTANNQTRLFGQPLAYNLFGQFVVVSGTAYTADFWIQYPGLSNGEFSTNTGLFSTLFVHGGGSVAGNTFQIQGIDVTGNNIILQFQNNLLAVSSGSVDLLTKVTFDNGSGTNFSDSSPVGGICIAGTCPVSVGGNAPETLAQSLAPEPSTCVLLGGGLVALCWFRKRRTTAA